MKFATAASLSAHAAALAGVYCLSSGGGSSFVSIEPPMRVEFLTFEKMSQVSLKEQAKSLKRTPQRKVDISKERSSINKGAQQHSVSQSDNSCADACAGAFSPSPLNAAPAYPSDAREKGIVGDAVFRIFLDPKGHATDVKLQSGTLHPILSEVAKQTLLTWRFHGKVPAYVDVPISFNLTDN